MCSQRPEMRQMLQRMSVEASERVAAEVQPLQETTLLENTGLHHLDAVPTQQPGDIQTNV